MAAPVGDWTAAPALVLDYEHLGRRGRRRASRAVGRVAQSWSAGSVCELRDPAILGFEHRRSRPESDGARAGGRGGRAAARSGPAGARRPVARELRGGCVGRYAVRAVRARHLRGARRRPDRHRRVWCRRVRDRTADPRNRGPSGPRR